MNIWIIFLIVAAIVLIGVVIWSIIKFITKLLELFDSLKDLIEKLKMSDIIDQLGSSLKKFAELEEIVKDKLGADEKKTLDDMKKTLEDIRKKIA